jgi:hypothetical protein
MRLRLLALAAGLLGCTLASAQFAAFVAPARFELRAKPGQKLQEVLEIGNDDLGDMELRIRTSDWTLRRDGGVDFQPDTLAPDSCRPWVKIERHIVKLGGKGRRRYRFEIEVPADAGDRLCRFSLLLEPANPAMTVSPLGNILMPVQGRIGVIVYVRVGDAKPRIELERIDMQQVNGQPTPVAILRNTGNAHGRPEGTLTAVDAAGRSVDLVVAPLPVLPGESRTIPMWPQEVGDGKRVALQVPLRVKGVIEWEGGRIPVESALR